ncbi:MAG: penicillin-binding transpeptidase domain-containing protein [Fibrobacterota bacterium]
MEKQKNRILLTEVGLLAFIVSMTVFLFRIQVLNSRVYSANVNSQSSTRVIDVPRRGAVYDARGRVAASSFERKTLVEIEEDSLEEDKIFVNRLYNFGRTAAPVIGWTGKEKGWGGIEYSFNQYLAGEPGYSRYRSDGRQRLYTMPGDDKVSAVDGSNVHLTIDMDVQALVEDVLAKTVAEFEAAGAFAVLMNPHNGDIVAMASSNGFNPNYWWKFSAPDRKSHPITFNYEPGSTYKTLTLAAALEEGLYSTGDSIDANEGIFEIYGELIRDHAAFKKLSLSEALWYSSNICFAKIGDSLGRERSYSYLKNYGFGSRTGIRLPGEEGGMLRGISEWSGRTSATVAFGHEFSGTLLQVVRAMGAIANGGCLVKPRIFTSVTDRIGDVLEENDVEVLHRVFSPQTALTVRRMMQGVVEHGTARSVSYPYGTLAGKTGTSEKIDPETGEYSSDKVCASFIGITPVDKPKLICGVVVDEPRDAAPGGEAAGPAVAEIFSAIAENPSLGYGLTPQKDTITVSEAAGEAYPDLSNKTRLEAARSCRSRDLTFEFVGDGEFVVNQTPEAGTQRIDDTPVLLFTNSYLESDGDIVMPNCVGRTMKDAINALSLEGISPVIDGRGTVAMQSPTAGTIVPSSSVCTLYCKERS